MRECYFVVDGGVPLSGVISVGGAKNAVLVELCSLLLFPGRHCLHNVPKLADVTALIELFEELGCSCCWLENGTSLTVDTTQSCLRPLSASVLQSFRASILLLGPLLARFGMAEISYPGGCPIGARPIDFHLKAFERMGAIVEVHGDLLRVIAKKGLHAARLVFEYPSVGATENVLLAAVLTRGTTTIVNAALEPEVLDLIQLLRSMGAVIDLNVPATISVTGALPLRAVEHTVLPDRLEAGTYLAAAAMTGGQIEISNIDPELLDVFLMKLDEMGHTVTLPASGGVVLTGTLSARAVSFITMPYPGFPTDLQAIMSALQICSVGTSKIHESVFENRLVHLGEFQKMGATLSVAGDRTCITGVDRSLLRGAALHGVDIRGAAGLVIAALGVADRSSITGIQHLRRGYDRFEERLQYLGARIQLVEQD